MRCDLTGLVVELAVLQSRGDQTVGQKHPWRGKWSQWLVDDADRALLRRRSMDDVGAWYERAVAGPCVGDTSRTRPSPGICLGSWKFRSRSGRRGHHDPDHRRGAGRSSAGGRRRRIQVPTLFFPTVNACSVRCSSIRPPIRTRRCAYGRGVVAWTEFPHLYELQPEDRRRRPG